MFQVEWVQSALEELAALWNRADSASRPAIRMATNVIDRRLERDPLNDGESRARGRRILFESPIAIS